MNEIKVSVIIPVFNGEKYLRECLNSVINQTLKNIEIICVDDGSTDNSLSILNEYAEKDRRVRVLTQPNTNAGAARNHGLRYATGKYLSFLDSDDFFELNMLEECWQVIEANEADILCFAAKQKNMITGEITEMPWSLMVDYLPNKAVFSPTELSSKLFNCFQNWPWNKLFRHDFVRKNNIKFQEIARTNDMLFTCSALVLAKRITTINHAFAFYRVGTGTSLQQTNYKHPIAFWDAFVETKRFLINSGQYKEYEQSFLNEVLGGILYNYHSVKDMTANAAVFCLIKYRGETEFQFQNHPCSYYYYYNQDLIKEYLSILNGEVLSCNGIKPYVDEKEAILASRKELIEAQERQLEALCGSLSYRIGRALTFIPRKIREMRGLYKKRNLR